MMKRTDSKEGKIVAKTTKKRHERVDITKKQFETMLEKVFARPVSGKSQESELEAKRTSVAHPSDDYSGKRKNQGKTEGKEG